MILLLMALQAVPEAARVTLSAESRPLGRVLIELARQCPGEKAACDPELEERPVKIDVAGRPFFEALHLLCTQNEGIRLEVGDEVRIRAGRHVPGATVCSGPFVFQLRDVRMTRSVQGDERRNLELFVASRSQGDVTPGSGEMSLAGFEETSDDDWEQAAPDPPERWSHVHRLEKKAQSGSLLGIKFGGIPPGLKTIETKGTARFHFILESESVEVDVPPEDEKEAGRPLEDKRFKISVSRDEKRLVVRLDGSVGHGEEAEGLFDLYGRRFKPDALEFLSEDGEPVAVEGGGSSTSWGGSDGFMRFYFNVEGEFPAKVRVKMPKKVHVHAVPVEFKGVPLE